MASSTQPKALSAAQRRSIGEKVRQRRVVMKSSSLDPSTGESVTVQAEDFVPEEALEAYLADARTRWQFVQADEGYDCGPGGEQAVIPPHLLDERGRIKAPAEFAKYGDASTPDNALDEYHGTPGAVAGVGLQVTNGNGA